MAGFTRENITITYAERNTQVLNITGNDQYTIAGIAYVRFTAVANITDQTAYEADPVTQIQMSFKGQVKGTGTYEGGRTYADMNGTEIYVGVDRITADDTNIFSVEYTFASGDTLTVDYTLPADHIFEYYVVPTITARQTGRGQPYIQVSGQYYSMQVDGEEKNGIASITYQLRRADETEMRSTVYTVTDFTTSGNIFDFTADTGVYLGDYNWVAQITVTDNLDRVATATVSILRPFSTYTINFYMLGDYLGEFNYEESEDGLGGLYSDLQFTKRMTSEGADTITFKINDEILRDWCAGNGQTVATFMRPIGLSCQIWANSEALVGGYLTSVPAYSGNGKTGTYTFNFSGFLNLLDKVYLLPQSTTGNLNDIIQNNWIAEYNTRISERGASGRQWTFPAGNIETLNSVTWTSDTYKSIKSAILERADNVTGAGPFEFYIHPDSTFDIISASNFGRSRPYNLIFPATDDITRVPNAYTEIEFVHIPRQSFINTNYYPTTSTTIDFTFGNLNLSNTSDSDYILGTGTASGNIYLRVRDYNWVSGRIGQRTFSFYSLNPNLYDTSTSIGTTKWHTTLSALASTASISWRNIQLTKPTRFTTQTNPLLINATLDSSGEALAGGEINVYGLSIMEATTVVHNFIPVKHTSGEIGLYDTIADEFIVASGATAGPETTAIGVASITTNGYDDLYSSAFMLGEGQTSSNSVENTAHYVQTWRPDQAGYYGYAEIYQQESSISNTTLLGQKGRELLAEKGTKTVSPKITLTPSILSIGEDHDGDYIWVGDRVRLINERDYTGLVNGLYQVKELTVSVNGGGGETITLNLEKEGRIDE